MQGDDATISDVTSAPVDSSPPPADTSSSSPAETSSNSQPAQTGESSGAESKESLLDAVLKVAPATPEPDVIDGTNGKEAAPASETQPDSEVKAEDEAADTDDQTPEDETVPDNVPAQTRKKINKLLRERRELREQVTTLSSSAEIGQQLQSYAEANNLSSQDVVFALDLASMVARGDLSSFYDTISPIIRHAQEVKGIVLPPDIQQMVDQQQMTPEAARQFAQSRFERVNYEAQVRNMNQRHQAETVHRVKGDVHRSVAAFEQRLMATDPDYKAKADMVRRTAQAMLAERGNQIASAEEALQITQRAYKEVNDQFRRIQPSARATAPTPGMSNHQTSSARAAPKNMMEAAIQGLARSRTG